MMKSALAFDMAQKCNRAFIGTKWSSEEGIRFESQRISLFKLFLPFREFQLFMEVKHWTKSSKLLNETEFVIKSMSRAEIYLSYTFGIMYFKQASAINCSVNICRTKNIIENVFPNLPHYFLWILIFWNTVRKHLRNENKKHAFQKIDDERKIQKVKDRVLHICC